MAPSHNRDTDAVRQSPSGPHAVPSSGRHPWS